MTIGDFGFQVHIAPRLPGESARIDEKRSMTRSHTVRRWIMRIALCGAIGAAITVTVAWGCALWIEADFSGPGGMSMPAGTRLTWDYWIPKRPGATLIYRVPQVVESADSQVLGFWNDGRKAVPSWSRVFEPVAESLRAQSVMFIEDARGWPLLSLRSETTVTPEVDYSPFPPSMGATSNDREQIRAGIRVAVERGSGRVVLPLLPIWSGFAFDTVLYGVLACAMLFGPGTLKRAIRRSAGRCPHCGYDLRGNESGMCPECGSGGEDAAR